MKFLMAAARKLHMSPSTPSVAFLYSPYEFAFDYPASTVFATVVGVSIVASMTVKVKCVT